MTMVRISLPDEGAAITIRTPERTVELKGGDHISLDLESEGSHLAIELAHPAEGIRKFVAPRDEIESPLRW